MVVFIFKTQFTLHFYLEQFHATLFPLLPLSHVVPCFPTQKLSSLRIVIFRLPYLTHSYEVRFYKFLMP
jgi:hypothetical protein